jgi:hypothetical protein
MRSARRLFPVISFVMPLALLALAACSSDSPSASATTKVATTTTAAKHGAPVTTVPVTGYLPSTTLGPTTTFMHNCTQMPTVTELSTLVGVPLSPGAVTGTGTCQYNALNNQSKFVLLSLLTAKADILAFQDLQNSLGASKPLIVKGAKGARVGADHSVWVDMNHTLYVVRTNVTAKPPVLQVPLSGKVLERWVQL